MTQWGPLQPRSTVAPAEFGTKTMGQAGVLEPKNHAHLGNEEGGEHLHPTQHTPRCPSWTEQPLRGISITQ